MAFVLGEDESFQVLDAATGREKWVVPFPARGSCKSVPVARGESVYVSRNVLVKAGDANQSQYFRPLVALDAGTGQERWRYPAAPAGTVGLCIDEAPVAGGTYFAVSGVTLYAINLATGRDLWPPVEVRPPVDGRERVPAHGVGRCGGCAGRCDTGRAGGVRQVDGPTRLADARSVSAERAIHRGRRKRDLRPGSPRREAHHRNPGTNCLPGGQAC